MSDEAQARKRKISPAMAERRKRALELRKAGMTYAEIARQLNVKGGEGSAWRIVRAALRALYQEPADDVRKMELERLNRLQLALWGRATGAKGQPPDHDAIDRLLKIINLRMKLLGLDQAPPRDVNVKFNRDASDAELESALKAMGYKRDEQRDPEATDRPA